MLHGLAFFCIAQGLCFIAHGFAEHGLHGLWLPAEAGALIIPMLMTKTAIMVINLFIWFSSILGQQTDCLSCRGSEPFLTNKKKTRNALALRVYSFNYSWINVCCDLSYHRDCMGCGSSSHTGYVSWRMGLLHMDSLRMGCTCYGSRQMPEPLKGQLPEVLQ